MRVVLAVAILASLAGSVGADDRVALTDKALTALRRNGACDKKAARWWCIATKWSTGTAEPLPVGKRLIGSWLYFKSGKIEEFERPWSFVVTDDHGAIKVWTADVETPKDRQHEHDAAIAVARVLEGKATTATVAPDVVADLAENVGKYTPSKVGNEWYWDDLSDDMRARKVGTYWVVILSPPSAAARVWPDGRVIAVFTDAWK